MFGQLFGKYLVGKSIIKEDIYRAIIDEQLSVRVKLGNIAIADGLLNEEQVEEINMMQRQQDKRFGDIAIEEGMLTPEQIEDLLSKQGDAYMQFMQLFMEKTGLNNKDADVLLQSFQKDFGYTDEEFEALKTDQIDVIMPLYFVTGKPHIKEIASLVVKNIMRFVTRDYYIGKARHVKELSYKHLAYQELSGDSTIFIGIAESEDEGGFLNVANEFSHTDHTEITYDAYDAIGEFINVTAGIYATELSKNETNIDMEPPLGFKAQKATGDFYILPIFVEDKQIDLIVTADADFVAGETPEVDSELVAEQSVRSDDSLADVLIVDDSRMSRLMLKNILEKANYHVVAEATNGEEGVELYKKNKPDIVTLDITMPKMDGLEALEAILKFDPDANAVMITAAGQQNKLIQALKVGAKKFINKPFNENDIIEEIGKLIGK